MRKHLRIWAYLFRMSFMESLEYRLNFVLRIMAEVVWYAAQLTVFEVLFAHTNAIGEWDIYAIRVFMGTLFMSDCIWMMFFNENFERFDQLVVRGELDLLLTKPVDSQFMISFRRMNPVYIINLTMMTGYFLWAVHQYPHPLEPVAFMKFFFLLVCGLAVVYSLRFFFVVLTLIVHNARSLTFVWHSLFRFCTRPHSIYPSWLRVVLISVLPLGLINSVPASHLLFPSDYTLYTSPLVALFLLWLSRRAWWFGLSKYVSASS